MARPEIGVRYRVVKPGAALRWWKPAGPHCHEGASRPLAVGDVITYERHAYGGMSDDVYYDYFRIGNDSGQFWPNNWGTCDMSFLEPVTAAVGAT